MIRSLIKWFLFILVLLTPVFAGVNSFTVLERILTSQNKVNQNQTDFNYSIKILNNDISVSKVSGFVKSTDPNLQVIDNSLNFGAIPQGGPAVSADTITLRRDNQVEFNPDSLEFEFQATPEKKNSRPIADAGTDQTIKLNAAVALDGTGSSDVNGDSLIFKWLIVKKPDGSNAELDDPTIAAPSFVGDKPGNYTFKLIVNDGKEYSTPDFITISTINSAPIADAGLPQTLEVGDTAILDGGSSSDVDGDQLKYDWKFLAKPKNSLSVLSNANEVKPQFVLDKEGVYEIQLIVNDGKENSQIDIVRVSTGNTAPRANAGADIRAAVNTNVVVDGTESSDVDGNVLSYRWSVLSRPEGSSAKLSDAFDSRPSILLDKPGRFIIQLIVNDGLLDSTPDTVIITNQNTKPVADLGSDITVPIAINVELDGTRSSDQDLDKLTYRSTISTRPKSSKSKLINPTSSKPSLNVDVPGTYVVQMIVNDGQVDSLASTALISAINSPPIANAGTDVNTVIGSTSALSGALSSDVDNNPLTYKWSVITKPAGSLPLLTKETTVSPNFVADKAGTYVVQLIVNDGVLNSTPDTLVLVATTPKVGIQASSITGKAPLEVTLNAVPNGGFSPYQFAWDLDGNGTVDDTRKNFVYSYLQNGSYMVNLKMTDAKGNVATATQAITVTSPPNVVASATPQSGAVPLTVKLSGVARDIDGTVNRYDWDFDSNGVVDFSSTTTPNATKLYNNAGLYKAKLTVFDNDGLSSSDTVIVAVGSSPQVTANSTTLTGVAPFTASFSGVANDSDGQISKYEWDFNGDKVIDYTSATTATSSFIFKAGGVYNATLRVTDNHGLIDEDSVIITVSGPPTSLPGAYPLSGEAPLKVTFFSDGRDFDGGPEFYDWDFDGNGTFDQRLGGSLNTTYTYSQPGTYKATLKVIDDDGLSSTATVTITVKPSTSAPQGTPTVSANATPTVGSTPLTTILTSIAKDIDGSIAKYEWDFESDGAYEFSELTSPLGLLTEAIDAGSYSQQTFADIDKDGDQDMFIGNSSGQIISYTNGGNANVFDFITPNPIKDSVGTTISVGGYATPYAYDIDGDSDFDLIVGNSSGLITIIENTGTIKIPKWLNKGTIKLAGGLAIDVGSYAAPIVYKAGNDSDWDLIVGNSSGNLIFLENTGTNILPAWVDRASLQDRNAVPINIGTYAKPLFIDHDGDGDLDLYIGESQGRVSYVQNQGNNLNPLWAGQGFLANTSAVTIDVGSYASPVVANTSGIATNDFWIGNSDGVINWFQKGTTAPLSWLLKASAFNGMDFNSYATPVSVDYDGNGISDLVVGNDTGNIQLINNIGTIKNPIFRLAGLIQNDQNIAVKVTSYASPTFGDLDNDGDLDLIVGDSGGLFNYYRNIGTNAVPKWSSQGGLKNSTGVVLDVGSYCSPEIVDYDGDGDQDILVGEVSGQLYLVTNTGSKTIAVWSSPVVINDANGIAIDVGSNSKPAISDFNRDGKADLLVGTSLGTLYQYENSSNSTPFSWILIDSTYQKIDVGSNAAPTTMNLDDDIDEDLIIGNSSGLIYQQKIYGNTTKNYITEGLHKASIRVTDNAGNKAVSQVNVTVLGAGYPSLSLNADVSEGRVPLKVNFVATAKDSDGTIASYEWDFDGDGVYEKTGKAKETFTYTKIGAFNPRVRVTDNTGKQATLSVPLKVTMQVTLAHNAVINPGLGEKSAISSILPAEAKVTLKVVDELGNVIKTLADGVVRPAGTYTDNWDGLNSLNNQVGEGAYYFVLSYDKNGVRQEIDARASANFTAYSPNRTWPTDFNPYLGIPVTSTYTVNKPSEVSFYFWVRDNTRPGSTIAPVRTLFTRELKAAGTHTEVWDGVNDIGVPVKAGEQYPITLRVYELAENAIIVGGAKPVISNIAVNNRVFDPSYNPYSTNTSNFDRVSFALSKDASLDVAVIDSKGSQISRITKANLTAGQNSIGWDGRDFKGQLVPAGAYSLQLTGTDTKGNRSLPRYAVVTVRY